jgi:hypothetical protein
MVVACKDTGNSGYGTARVGTVSGTSISFGTAVVFESSDTQFIGSTFDSTNNKVVIVYADYTNNTRPTAIVGTVSGTDISFGTKVQIASENQTNSLQRGVAFDSTNGKVLVTYAPNGDTGSNVQFKSAVGTVSGTSISFGDQVTIDSDGISGSSTGGQNSVVFDADAGKMIVAYPDTGNSNKLTIVDGIISGTTVTYGAVAVHDNNGTGSITASAIDPSSGAVLTALRSGADSDKGKGIVNKISFTNLALNNFIGISDAAYSDGNTATIQIAGAVDDAQSSLTIGENYFVTTGGTIATTGSVFAGKAISATELAVKYPAPTLELISHVTASGSTEIDLTGMSSAYKIYKVYFKGFPSTSMALQIRFFTNGVIGTSSNTYGFLGIYSTQANNATSRYDNPYSNDKIKWDGSSDWNDQFVGEITINASADSSYGGVIATGSLAALYNTSGLRNSHITMVHNSGTSQITGIRLYPSTGNFATGEFYLFGVNA